MGKYRKDSSGWFIRICYYCDWNGTPFFLPERPETWEEVRCKDCGKETHPHRTRDIGIGQIEIIEEENER